MRYAHTSDKRQASHFWSLPGLRPQQFYECLKDLGVEPMGYILVHSLQGLKRSQGFAIGPLSGQGLKGICNTADPGIERYVIPPFLIWITAAV